MEHVLGIATHPPSGISHRTHEIRHPKWDAPPRSLLSKLEKDLVDRPWEEVHDGVRVKLTVAAPGLTPRAVLNPPAAVQLMDVHVPITDGCELVMPRYTEPETEQEMILNTLRLTPPKQPPPRIRSNRHHASEAEKSSCRRTLQRSFVVQTLGVKTALTAPQRGSTLESEKVGLAGGGLSSTSRAFSQSSRRTYRVC